MATTEIPPKPTRDPDVHLKDGSGRRKAPRTLKGDLGKLRGKVSAAVAKVGDGRKSAEEKKGEVREQAKEVLKPVSEKVDEEKKLVGEVMKPVYRAVGAVKAGLDPANGTTRPYVTSFGISAVVSWVLSPQILVAAYERIRFHTSTTGWGILHGPGRWFRDTVGRAAETGQTFGLVAAICLGLAPMLLFSVRNGVARHLAESPYYNKAGRFAIKWLARAPYLVPAIYLTGVSYPEYITPVFGSPWRLEMWHFYVAGLFCTAYYFTMWVFDRVEKGLGLGYFHVLLMTPLASIVTGALLYAPGAAW